MNLSESYLALINSENEGTSSNESYLRYTKLEQGKPANFALLEQDPLATGLSGVLMQTRR